MPRLEGPQSGALGSEPPVRESEDARAVCIFLSAMTFEWRGSVRLRGCLRV